MAMVRCVHFLLVLISISLVNCDDDGGNYKIIKTNQGSVRGQKLRAIFYEKDYYSFKGIPYAEPPVDQLRYKPPVPAKPWTDIRDAINYGHQCIQATRTDDFIIIGEEDCLYLNVHVPEKVDSKLSVMVYIHSGGYYYGSGDSYGPDFLVSNDVIVVTFNYRLGVLGYLSLGTEEYPGNMGMKDQQLVLKWVHENIEHFGGDINKITLFGESAGATSTHLHMLSPSSQNLFQRVILMSGSALTTWSSSYKNNYLDELHEIAGKFGHNTENNQDLMTFYYKVDPKVLIRETNRKFYIVGAENRVNNMVWQPLVEVPQAKDPFLSKYPEQYLLEPTNTKYDILTGHTSAEMYFATAPELLNPALLKPFDETFHLQLPWPIIKTSFKSKLYKKISRAVRDFYFPNNVRIDKNTLKEYSELMDDLFFTYAQYTSAILDAERAKNAKIYFYIFAVQTEINLVRKLTGVDRLNMPGVSHLEDLFYIFRLNDATDPFFNYPYENLSNDSVEVQKIKQITKVWTDFAKFGHPTPDSPDTFKAFTPTEMNFVTFTNEGPVSGKNTLPERMQFWDSLYDKYKDSFEMYVQLNKHEEL